MRFSKEEEYLRQKDKKLKKIIDMNGHIVFKPETKNFKHIYRPCTNSKN